MRKLLLIICAVALGTLSSVAAYQHVRSDADGWHEIGWPFPRDGWPAGRAFRCGGASCGEGIELYVRPKLGFCNCDSGVADDDEVDRVADLDLMSAHFVSRQPGSAIRLAGMSGRLRAYDLTTADGSRHPALGIALSRRCDLLVAVAKGANSASAIERVALKFLATGDMSRWMVASLNGG